MVTTFYEFRKGKNRSTTARIEDRAARKNRSWYTFGAIVGLAGGIIAALIGSVLTAITWFTGTDAVSSFIHTLGTSLLFMTIPLLILGAHCLDRVEKEIEKSRKSHVGLVEEQDAIASRKEHR